LSNRMDDMPESGDLVLGLNDSRLPLVSEATPGTTGLHVATFSARVCLLSAIRHIQLSAEESS
jgi:hypothetical protein